jgi:hypothetical protein
MPISADVAGGDMRHTLLGVDPDPAVHDPPNKLLQREDRQILDVYNGAPHGQGSCGYEPIYNKQDNGVFLVKYLK